MPTKEPDRFYTKWAIFLRNELPFLPFDIFPVVSNEILVELSGYESTFVILVVFFFFETCLELVHFLVLWYFSCELLSSNTLTLNWSLSPSINPVCTILWANKLDTQKEWNGEWNQSSSSTWMNNSAFSRKSAINFPPAPPTINWTIDIKTNW